MGQNKIKLTSSNCDLIVQCRLVTVFDNMELLVIEKLKYRSHNMQNIRLGEMKSRIFEIYKNAVRPHGCHIHKTAPGMAMATVCPFPYKNHTLSHRKYVLHCCDKCPSIFIPGQEKN